MTQVEIPPLDGQSPDGQVQAAEAPVELAIVAGPSAFVTLRDVTVAPTQTGFTLTCNTDLACTLSVRWYPQNGESLGAVSGGSGSQADAGPVAGKHTIVVTMGTGHYGNTFGFEITNTDVPPPTLRPYQGSFQILGARRTAVNNAVPVRFYGFDGPMDASAPAGQNGNWSNYTWAQYNPKGL